MISKKTWKAIDYILKNCPSAVFGGSIALTAVGLLNREVGDIDLFFQEGDSLTRNGFLKGEPTMNPNIGSDTITDVNGKQIQRTSVEVHGIKTCCFKIPFEQWQYSEILFNGRRMKIQNVNYAIAAKFAWQERNEKHKEDIEQIKRLIESVTKKDWL